MHLNLLLCSLCSPDLKRAKVWLSAAPTWHLLVFHACRIKKKKERGGMTAPSCWSACLTERLHLSAVIWSSECASSSTAPSSSSGSSRRMPGNTPAVQATASASRPRHRPTWLFSVSVTLATKWVGEGDSSRARGAAAAAAVWRQWNGPLPLWCKVAVLNFKFRHDHSDHIEPFFSHFHTRSWFFFCTHHLFGFQAHSCTQRWRHPQAPFSRVSFELSRTLMKRWPSCS